MCRDLQIISSESSVTNYWNSFFLFKSQSLEICGVSTAVHIEAVIYMRMYHCIVRESKDF
jgi:hypothetical protein